MSENIIDINAYKPHLSGEAKCLACGHEWHAVAPIGTAFFECPECGLFKGQRKCDCDFGDEIFQCNCGCYSFAVRIHCVSCLNCGISTNYEDLLDVEDKSE